MPPVHFQISYSRVVQESFERLLDMARAEGRLPLALRAARYMWDELAYDPMAFGESRGHLAAAGLHLRMAFARPWCVKLGVHEEQRIVFLRSFRLVR